MGLFKALNNISFSERFNQVLCFFFTLILIKFEEYATYLEHDVNNTLKQFNVVKFCSKACLDGDLYNEYKDTLDF